MISKELLSEVLKIDDIVHIQKEGINYLFISRANNQAIIINIYELAHKCKDWAYSKDYSYLSGRDDIFFHSYKYICSVGIDESSTEDFYADTEVEAIFKACQWILDNEQTK